MQRPTAILSLGSTLFALSLCAGAPAKVTVDANTAVVLGDVSEISGNLFGITAFKGGAPWWRTLTIGLG